jgi:hypothetical protein
MVRERVLSRLQRCLQELHIDCAHVFPDDIALIGQLEQPARFDHIVACANLLMERLGAKPAKPKEPRFDKTRRALAKKTPKGPRGVRKRDHTQVRQSLENAHGEA